MTEDPDTWYERHADEIAHWEGEIMENLRLQLQAWLGLDLSSRQAGLHRAALGRHSSGFPKEIEEVCRQAWQHALSFDGLQEQPIVRFSPENPWPKRFDHMLQVAQSLGVKVDIR